MGKSSMNIATMQAQEQAQGQQLNSSKVLNIIGSFALMFGADVSFYTWNIIPGIIAAAIIGVIAYYRLVPKEINARYFRYGMSERHSFMSGITQIFGDGHNHITVPEALRESLVDLYGAFKQDIEGLISVISESGAGKKSHYEFEKIRDEYAGDIWFTDFMQQLETTQDQGIVNADAFHDIMRNADALFDNQYKYEQEKILHKRMFYIVNVCILICLYFMVSGFGLHNYISIFAHSGFGWIISGVYILYTFFLFHKMYQYNYDESIVSMK